MKENTLIRKKYCVTLASIIKPPVIRVVNTTNPELLKKKYGSSIASFYTFERLLYLTSDDIILMSEELNSSKIYLVKSRLVSERRLQNVVRAEATGDYSGPDDAKKALAILKANPSAKIVECKFRNFFFEYDEDKYQIL